MKELSLHILDIAQNSVKAGAGEIEIILSEEENRLVFAIKDNGCGMSEDMVKAVEDPFTTSRTTRKVGLGIPLLKLSAEQTGGGVSIKSREGEGTALEALFRTDSIDCPPLGDIAGAISLIIQGLPDNTRLIYKRLCGGNEFVLDTDELHKILGNEVSLAAPEIILWISDYLKENEENCKRKEIS